MSKLYNIIDTQLGQYYEEGITLEEAKEHALRFVERGMLEVDGESKVGYREMMVEVGQDKTFEDVAESLALFDYELEEV